jgi:opacity protein-like surface antigen
MRTKLTFLTILFAFACSGAVQAQPTQGFYGGIALGKARADLNGADFTFSSAAVRERRDDTNTGHKFFGGYQFGRYLAAELSYTDFGSFKYNYDLAAVGRGREWVDYRATSWAVSGVGTLPVRGRFSLLARLGLSSNMAESSELHGDPSAIAATVPFVPAKKRKSAVIWGAGGQFDFSRDVGLRLEYESYGNFGNALSPVEAHTGRAKIRMWSLGILARF